MATGLAKHIVAMRRPADVVVFSIHWGENWGYQIPQEQRDFAHILVDLGAADIIHGHSSHHRKAIEVYRNKLILYGCGDFLNDYEGISGEEDFRGQLVLMYFATVNPSTGDLISFKMTPFEIRRLQLHRAGRPEAEWLSDVLNREGARFGTKTILNTDNQLEMQWQ
jgi:poly-gamma-glutamate synthesis protein (capsule biosynthesis protein)